MKEFHFTDDYRELLKGYGLSDEAVRQLERHISEYQRHTADEPHLATDRRAIRKQLKKIERTAAKLLDALDGAGDDLRVHWIARHVSVHWAEGLDHLGAIARWELEQKSRTRKPDVRLRRLDKASVKTIVSAGIPFSVVGASGLPDILQVVRRAATRAAPDDCRKILRRARTEIRRGGVIPVTPDIVEMLAELSKEWQSPEDPYKKNLKALRSRAKK